MMESDVDKTDKCPEPKIIQHTGDGGRVAVVAPTYDELEAMVLNLCAHLMDLQAGAYVCAHRSDKIEVARENYAKAIIYGTECYLKIKPPSSSG